MNRRVSPQLSMEALKMTERYLARPITDIFKDALDLSCSHKKDQKRVQMLNCIPFTLIERDICTKVKTVRMETFVPSMYFL